MSNLLFEIKNVENNFQIGIFENFESKEDLLKLYESLIVSTEKEFDKILGKKFGKQYHGFGDANKFESIERVSLDSISLNKILGGGLPVGRMIEVFGEELI